MTTTANQLTRTSSAIQPASAPHPTQYSPWLAALTGAFTAAFLAFLAVGIGGAIGGWLDLLALAACFPGMLLFALWTALPVPLDGLPYTSLHDARLLYGALIVGVGSLLFWGCVGGTLSYWRCARKQR